MDLSTIFYSAAFLYGVVDGMRMDVNADQISRACGEAAGLTIAAVAGGVFCDLASSLADTHADDMEKAGNHRDSKFFRACGSGLKKLKNVLPILGVGVLVNLIGAVAVAILRQAK